jgi:hypothetical protein
MCGGKVSDAETFPPHTHYPMSTFDENKVDRTVKGAAGAGQFATQIQSSPELAALGFRTPVDFEDRFTLVRQPNGDVNFEDYDEALKAAGGDADKVWTVVEGEYPEGPKIWEVSNHFADMTVHISARHEDEAINIASKQFRASANANGSEFNLDDESEIWVEGVYVGELDKPETWSSAPNMYVSPGKHFVNALNFVVTEEPATVSDYDEEYVWG